MPKAKKKKEIVYKTTPKQKRAVDNIISGKYPSKRQAMKAAGYTEKSANRPNHALESRQGTKTYLKTLKKRALKKWDSTLEDKVADTYLDGLESTKLYGKNNKEHPDFAVRKRYADFFSSVFGWTPQNEDRARNPQVNTFNFFSIKEDERKQFNKNLKDFLEGQIV